MFDKIIKFEVQDTSVYSISMDILKDLLQLFVLEKILKCFKY